MALLFFSPTPTLQRFWRWWKGQLAPLLPRRLRDWYAKPERYCLALDGERVTLYRQTEATLDSVEHLAFEALAAWGKTKLDEDRPLTLLLKPGQYLSRHIVLPAAVRENLQQVIGFELDRHTPFTAEQVYYTARILKSLPEARIRVEVVVVLKDHLNAQLAKLAAIGLHPSRVSILPPAGDTPPEDLDLLPGSRRPVNHPWRHRLNVALAFVWVMLVATALALPLLQQQWTIEALSKQQRKARKAAQEVGRLRQEVENLHRQSRFVLEKKQARPPMIDILETLSRILPQDTWLTALHYRQGQLQIDGNARTASKLVELLENAPYFHNVRFVSPITQDHTTGLERFRISMDVRHDDTQ